MDRPSEIGLPRGTNEERLHTIIKWVEEFEESTYQARSDAERDRDYYDGEQWTGEELKKLAEKNQPPVVMNRIFPRINDTLGAEDENRTDPRALPRSYNAHNEEAEAATDALRYWEENVEFDEKALLVLENLAIEGVGGCVFELDTEPDPGKDGRYDRNVISLTYVPWDRLFWDPHSRDPYFEDAMYKGILTWMHYGHALKKYPNKVDILEQTRYSATTGKQGESTEDKPIWFHTSLNRVAIREIWWKELNDLGHYVWFYAAFTSEGFLVEPEEVIWRTDRNLTWCPLRMTSGFIKRKSLDRYGIVRHMIWPQDEVNKRRSKALWHFTADRVLFEEGAVESPSQFVRELAQGGAAKVNQGALEKNKVIPHTLVDKGQAHLQLALEAKGEIDELGPYANLPEGVPQDLSARSFFAQQQAGMRKVGPIFQHFRRWKRDIYRCAWWAIRQFWPEERWIRVRDKHDSMGFRFRQLNRRTTKGEYLQELLKRGDSIESAMMSAFGPEGMTYLAEKQAELQEAQAALEQAGQPLAPPEAEQLLLRSILRWPAAKEEFTVGDLTKLDVDIIVEVTPESTILEHEQFTMLSEMARNGIPIPPDVIIKNSLLHNKQEILDAINRPPPPEQVQFQQQQMQLQLASLQAQVEKLMGEAQKAQAQAQQAMADAQKKSSEAQVGVPAEAERDIAQAEKLRGEIDTLRAEAEKFRADAKAKPVEARAEMIRATKLPSKPFRGDK